MKLKAVAGALVCASLLIGCASSEDVQWQKESSAMVENTNINLESRMWLNKMPMIGEEPSTPLHGSIILSADQDIPADLGVVSICFAIMMKRLRSVKTTSKLKQSMKANGRSPLSKPSILKKKWTLWILRF